MKLNYKTDKGKSFLINLGGDIHYCRITQFSQSGEYCFLNFGGTGGKWIKTASLKILEEIN